jgi:hypothetical protein
MITFFTLLSLLVFGSNIVQAQEYTASPSAQPKVSATPTQASILICQELKVVKGTGATAPETVSFETVTRNDSQIKAYRYHFGDGTVAEGERVTEHRYIGGGTFTAFVEVQDTSGRWQTSAGCETKVTLKQPPLVSGKVACGEVVVVQGSGLVAPAEIIAQVNGKGEVQDIVSYRVDFGDGTIEEAVTSRLEHTYLSPGTYQLKGYVKDGMGVMYGGTDACITTAKVLSAQPLTVQPETGVSTSTWIMIAGMAFSAVIMRLLASLGKHA